MSLPLQASASVLEKVAYRPDFMPQLKCQVTRQEETQEREVSYLQAQQDVLNGVIDTQEANDTNLMRKNKQTYCAMCVCAWVAAISVMDVFICGISRGTCYATAHKMWHRCLGQAWRLN